MALVIGTRGSKFFGRASALRSFLATSLFIVFEKALDDVIHRIAVLADLNELGMSGFFNSDGCYLFFRHRKPRIVIGTIYYIYLAVPVEIGVNDRWRQRFRRSIRTHNGSCRFNCCAPAMTPPRSWKNFEWPARLTIASPTLLPTNVCVAHGT